MHNACATARMMSIYALRIKTEIENINTEPSLNKKTYRQVVIHTRAQCTRKHTCTHNICQVHIMRAQPAPTPSPTTPPTPAPTRSPTPSPTPTPTVSYTYISHSM
jgi:hypothetical protein